MDNEQWSQLRQDLIRAVADGDEAVLRSFYDQHFGCVYRYVLCRVEGNHADAEEVVADVFFQALRDIASYDGERAPDGWLRGIARHRVVDFFRRTRRKLVLEVAFSRFDEAFLDRLFDLESSEVPEQALERNEMASLVELVLSDLPADYETVLRLKYLEEKPVNEMASILQTTPKATEAKLYRARTAFRDAFRLLRRHLSLNGASV